MFIKYFFTCIQVIPQRREFIPIAQGDCIYHPHHGIGKVQSISSRSFSGENDTRFAEIFFGRECITLLVREDSLDNIIRAPMSLSLAKNLLHHMKNWKTKVSDQWKTRANTHQAMMEEGDPRACAEVYKDLRVLEQDNALSTTDRKHLKRCKSILSEELAIALGQTQVEALDQMTQATQV